MKALRLEVLGSVCHPDEGRMTNRTSKSASKKSLRLSALAAKQKN